LFIFFTIVLVAGKLFDCYLYTCSNGTAFSVVKRIQSRRLMERGLHVGGGDSPQPPPLIESKQLEMMHDV